MLGHDLAEVFKDYSPIIGDIDITDKKEVYQKIALLKPEIVINAAAYTAVDDCQTNKELAMAVNGYALEYLAKACKDCRAILVHYSTDYVFDGKNPSGYKEDDRPGIPVNVYGQSKLLGEELLMKNTDKFYLLRTAWLYGKNGKNFPKTILHLAKERDTLRVVNDQHGSPTYTLDLAKKTKAILEASMPFGIYHTTNSGHCTWYELAKKVFELSKIKIKVEPITSKEFPTPAKRPKYSILINTKLPPMRSWEEALKEYLL
jgi:dTDP-4-dehydrorhamnose reductase